MSTRRRSLAMCLGCAAVTWRATSRLRTQDGLSGAKPILPRHDKRWISLTLNPSYDATQASPRVLLVGVPGRLLRIVRAVVDLDHHGVLVRDRGAVHVALGIAVEAAGSKHRPGRGVFVSAAQAEHELVGRVQVRLGDA